MITDDRKEALEKIWGEEVYPEAKRRLIMRDVRNEANPDLRRVLAIVLHGIAMSMELAAQGRPFARVNKCFQFKANMMPALDFSNGEAVVLVRRRDFAGG